MLQLEIYCKESSLLSKSELHQNLKLGRKGNNWMRCLPASELNLTLFKVTLGVNMSTDKTLFLYFLPGF